MGLSADMRTQSGTGSDCAGRRAAAWRLVFLLAVGLGLMAGLATEAAPTAEATIFLHHRELNPDRTNEVLVIRGAEARQQLLVTARGDDGALSDLTREVEFKVSPENLAMVDGTGVLKPLGDGTGSVTARARDGRMTVAALKVEKFTEPGRINFANQIVPIFTKTGCNGGGCHGKSSGQNGFRLSLLGFEPGEDYEHLVKESRGRRVFVAAPEHSLLLLKGAAIVPHGGGKRLDPESDDYRLLVQWISLGMPRGSDTDPRVERIEVYPRERTLSRGASQQLSVQAIYTDGSSQDVTRSALFEPNDKNMAKVGETGLVELYQEPGDVAVMVRYQAKVAVFRATVPLGGLVGDLPPSRNFIDDLVFKKLRTIGMPASEVCDDATFLRRATLDITGRLPAPEKTLRFLESKDPAKRDRLVEELVDSADYADFFANKWSALLRNKRGSAGMMRANYAFHSWVRDGLMDNKPFDQFVREIVAATGEVRQNPAVAWYRQVKEPTTQLEDCAQLFLGMRLQCAQCHHHPYERWSQQDYYGFAAFFSQVGRAPGSEPGEEVIFHKRGSPTATNKKSKQPVKPAGLGAATLDLPVDQDPRQALGAWLTSGDNRFFARSLANRYWKHFFGRGLVEPEDDLRDTNPATNPELLDALASRFVESGFDLKQLLRTICQSSTYQLSATPNGANAVDRQNFSRCYPKRLNAEVLLDAVDLVTAAKSKFDGLPAGTRAVQLPDNSFNVTSYFLTVFGRPEGSSACECERSQEANLAQSLHLLNSKEVQAKLTSDEGRAASLARDKSRSDEEMTRDLYLQAFSRPPSDQELALAKGHLARRAASADPKQDAVAARRQAWEDVIWALINTKEFLFNH